MSIRHRVGASLAIATTVVGAAGTLAIPAAHADDPLQYQNNIITSDRHKYGPNCPPLQFNPTLESMAQDATDRSEESSTFIGTNSPPDASRYHGDIRYFSGAGDPHDAALTDAYKDGAGPMLSNCDFTEFGTSFYRHANAGRDSLMIIFGKPALASPAAPVAPAAPAGAAAPPAGDTGPSRPAQPTVTVKKESDVFDAPDGNGNRIGPRSYHLAPNRVLPLVQPCANDWCLLNIGDPEEKAMSGQGWVFAGIQNGQDFLKIN